jgi:hypothetical protein
MYSPPQAGLWTVLWAIKTRPHKNYIQSMSYTLNIKPISFLKANAAQVLRDLAANQTPW